MDTTTVLAITAASLAILHTLLPDHELPLAMIGRAQHWSIKKMAGVTLIAGIIHISVSMVLGVIAVGISSVLAQKVALTGHRISGIFLIGFGLIYAILAWRARAHSHAHPHDHNISGSEGKTVITGSAWIVAIVGIAPCFTLIPVLVDAMWFGTGTVMLVMFVYAVSTIGSMVILTSIALKAITFLTRLEKIERHIELLAGIIIIVVGLYVVLPELFFPKHRHF